MKGKVFTLAADGTILINRDNDGSFVLERFRNFVTHPQMNNTENVTWNLKSSSVRFHFISSFPMNNNDSIHHLCDDNNNDINNVNLNYDYYSIMEKWKLTWDEEWAMDIIIIGRESFVILFATSKRKKNIFPQQTICNMRELLSP